MTQIPSPSAAFSELNEHLRCLERALTRVERLGPGDEPHWTRQYVQLLVASALRALLELKHLRGSNPRAGTSERLTHACERACRLQRASLERVAQLEQDALTLSCGPRERSGTALPNPGA